MQTETSPAAWPDAPAVLRAAIVSEMLWTAGYAVSSGHFLLYFARDLGASGPLIAWLIVLPELVGIAGLGTRSLARLARGRKRLWQAGTWIARIVAAGIPLLALAPADNGSRTWLWAFVGLLGVSQAAQAVASVAYASWLANYIPPESRARFFGRRNKFKIATLLVVPTAAGFARDAWQAQVQTGALTADVARMLTSGVFLVGLVCMLLSLWPLRRLPESPWPDESLPAAAPPAPAAFGWLTAFAWWHALWAGLTQSAFFLFRVNVLGLGLGTTWLLDNLMRVLQVPAGMLSGWLCDRFGSKPVLQASVVILAGSLGFWMLAGRGDWRWLIGAYMLWAAWSGINIGLPHLTLDLAPRRDNLREIALVERVGGLLAGLSGLAGGYLLAEFNRRSAWGQLGGIPISTDGYHLLFLLGMLGRTLSLLWLVPLKEPGARTWPQILSILRRWRRRRSAQTLHAARHSESAK